MLDKNVLIGLDLGTTNAKAFAYTLTGEVVSQASITYPTYYPHAGWSEQNPRDWQMALKATLSQLSSELKEQGLVPAGIGLSAHAPGLVLTDALGQPLGETFPIWQDARALLQSRQLYRDMGSGWVGLGFPIASFVAKLLWFIQEKPEMAARARYALGIKGFLIHWLTGNFATEPSSEPGNEPAWHPFCQYCGWSVEKLPPLVGSTDVGGILRQHLADEIGLPRNLPVIMGINDGGSAALANGALANGESVIQLATNGVVYMATSNPIPAEIRYKHAIFCWHYLEDYWIAGGQTKCGAENLHWLAKVTTGQTGSSDIELLLDEAATSPPGSRGVIYLPYLMGRGTPGDNARSRGAFYGLELSTGRADIVRAVLEGVVFAIKEIFDDFTQQGYLPAQVYITGGGARSRLWRQIVANVLDQNVIYSAADSCLGGAILAAVGVGIHPDLKTAVKAMTHPVALIQPESQAAHQYQQVFKLYQQFGNSLPELASE